MDMDELRLTKPDLNAVDSCNINKNRSNDKGTIKNVPLSISLIPDERKETINAEVLSISPLRNYIICINEYTKALFIVLYSKSTEIHYSDIPLFHEISNVQKITWEDSESYFDIYYDTPDEDQCIIEDGHRFLIQHICRSEIKKNEDGFLEIENTLDPLDPFVIQKLIESEWDVEEW